MKTLVEKLQEAAKEGKSISYTDQWGKRIGLSLKLDELTGRVTAGRWTIIMNDALYDDIKNISVSS